MSNGMKSIAIVATIASLLGGCEGVELITAAATTTDAGADAGKVPYDYPGTGSVGSWKSATDGGTDAGADAGGLPNLNDRRSILDRNFHENPSLREPLIRRPGEESPFGG